MANIIADFTSVLTAMLSGAVSVATTVISEPLFLIAGGVVFGLTIIGVFKRLV